MKVFAGFLLQYIEEYRGLMREILSLPSIEHYDMIKLDCEDLKRGLADKVKSLFDQLLDKVAADHRLQNERSGTF